MNYLPTCTSRLVVQHLCHVSSKSIPGCRRSWEDKLKCVKILSVKGHKSGKIFRTWIISSHALLDLWYKICTEFNSNPCKDVGGVEKTNFDVREWRDDGVVLQTFPLADLPPEDLQHCRLSPGRSATLQTFPQGGRFATLAIFPLSLQIFPGGRFAMLQTFPHFCNVPDSHFRMYWKTLFEFYIK